MTRENHPHARPGYLGNRIRHAPHSRSVEKAMTEAPLNCGDHLSHSLRQSHYVVSEWRGKALPRPGWDRQWAFIGGQYVLAEISTGLVLAVVTCIQ